MVKNASTPSIPVSLSELENALLWASGGASPDNAAFVSRASGKIFWRSEEQVFEEEELPDDVDDEALYARVPAKRDLDLGQRLVFRFIEEHAPDDYSKVRSFFGSRGAYARFKDLLEYRGLLDAWHAYEDQATTAALRDWAEAEGFEVVDAPPAGD